MRVIMYDEKMARYNKAYRGLGELTAKLFLLLMSGTFLMIFGILKLPKSFQAVVLVIYTIYFISVILYFVITSKSCMTAAYRGIVIDEYNVPWMVQIIPNTITPVNDLTTIMAFKYNTDQSKQSTSLAQNPNVIYNYYIRFRNGEKLWNKITGGEAKVFPMYRLTVIKNKTKCCVCNYMDMNNKLKKITIIKAYPGFIQ